VNIWERIPLEDYEKHMRHETVGQSQLLSSLTKKYLDQFAPNTVMFLGVSGGNGLEHIDTTITHRVYGIDINEAYLEATRVRFQDRIPHLELIKRDLSEDVTEIAKVDFVWAGLIFEYIEIGRCFQFITNNVKNKGHVVVTVQVNNGASSVSKTGVESVKLAGQIFKPVESSELLATAERYNFKKIAGEENELPNGKTFKTFCFIKEE
jgi:hypothetical protein